MLPLLSLLLGSVKGEARPEPRSFQRGPDRPALRHGAEELAHSRRLDRPVQPGHRPRAGLGGEPHQRAVEAADPGHRHALLSVAAVPHRHRVHLPVQPERRADQRPDARRARLALAHLQHLLDAGLVLVTVLHTFPFVYLLASSALQSVDASYEEAAQILGASKLRTAFSITAPLVAPAILSGTLLAFVNALALFGSQAIIGLPGRIFTLPTRIYALFDYPPEYGLASALSLVLVLITVVALYLQRAFLSRRSYVTLGGKGSRPQLMDLGAFRWVLLGFVLLDLPRLDRGALCDADRGVVLEVLGARFLEGPDARELQVHPVRLQRHPARHRQQPAARDRRGLHRGAARRDHRLDRPAHPPAGPQAARLHLAHSARAARHRGRGRADPVLARHADRALRHAGDPAAGLCGPLHSARRARRQCLAAPDRSRRSRKARRFSAPPGRPPCARSRCR